MTRCPCECRSADALNSVRCLPACVPSAKQANLLFLALSTSCTCCNVDIFVLSLDTYFFNSCTIGVCSTSPLSVSSSLKYAAASSRCCSSCSCTSCACACVRVRACGASLLQAPRTSASHGPTDFECFDRIPVLRGKVLAHEARYHTSAVDQICRHMVLLR